MFEKNEQHNSQRFEYMRYINHDTMQDVSSEKMKKQMKSYPHFILINEVCKTMTLLPSNKSYPCDNIFSIFMLKEKLLPMGSCFPITYR